MKGVISLKKRIIPLILLLAMLLSLSAYAASPRVMTILPAISFDGTTANCRVSVSADRSTDQISAVIQLWNGSTRIARKNSIFPTLKSLWTVTAGATSARPPKTAQQKMVS